ncbi:hypothetical protein ATANTOWER_030355 [Ataeniobius toweri]|uniref:Uncharacterized protein n=1 Tax=Ataeniobius toweri TaxID=208326 RepID=A0ABU7CA45_9TELE|nr:hypothetical protein [Ataeniobius toweri]
MNYHFVLSCAPCSLTMCQFFYQKSEPALLPSLFRQTRNLTLVHFALSNKEHLFKCTYKQSDFPIEYNVGSVQVCLVLFWSSDCQEFIRETAWGKKLSLWQLVLVNSAL